VVKRWIGAHGATVIFVDRDGKAPYEAHVRADSNGATTKFAYPLSTRVAVGEPSLTGGWTATIDCGSGAMPYGGGPFFVTSPAKAGETHRCVIVNRAPAPPPHKVHAKPTPKPHPNPVVKHVTPKKHVRPKPPAPRHVVPKPRPPAPLPALVVSKVASTRMLRVGQTVDYVITVRNRGRGEATNINVCDRLPDGLVFVRARGALFASGNACWRIVRLRAHRHRVFAVRLAPSKTERRVVIVNTVTVIGASLCTPRAVLGSTAHSTCMARAAVIVLPARHKARGGGVTG
jgi:uncharacterized repeat protein (TIGR01451 family)